MKFEEAVREAYKIAKEKGIVVVLCRDDDDNHNILVDDWGRLKRYSDINKPFTTPLNFFEIISKTWSIKETINLEEE